MKVKDTKDSKHRWTVTYREKPEIQETEINRGKKVVTIDLPAGEYFIADWQGFFQPIRKAKLAYSGHWLKVGK